MQVQSFTTGSGRKTDRWMLIRSRWSHCAPLLQVQVDLDLQVTGMLIDRRDELGRARTHTINRLHRLLLDLFPGGQCNSRPHDRHVR